MPISSFYSNTGGVNLTDSPLTVQDNQATGGYNYDYTKTGAISKSRGRSKINSAADSQLKTLGLAVHNTSANVKTLIRCAGTKIQSVNLDTQAFTNISEDTSVAGSDFLSSSSTQPVVSASFNTPTANLLWLAGGGMSSVYAYGNYQVNGEYTFITSGAGSGLFVTGNTVAFSINGRSYSVPFLTDNITTLNNIATAISADQDVSLAFITDHIHTITITSKNAATLTFTGISVTGGATQPTITVTQTIAPNSAFTNVVTANGVAAPTGTFTAVNRGTGNGGQWSATGTYYYAIAHRKKSTQAISNAALDVLVTIATATDAVLLTFPTGVDTTKYDKRYVYRSAVSGATSFTTGTLIAEVDINTPTFTDTGAIAIATAEVVPRAGNTTDNSVLPTGTYNCLTAFKRRLVAAKGSTFYLSDMDKPESWPTANSFTIPTGGDITAVGVIGYNSPVSSTTDEYLVVCKESETWVFTGNSISDWVLKYVDAIGCAGQSLMVPANGFLAWVDYRGIYMWDGVGKPIYVSRPIEALFGYDGDIDKSKITYGWGRLFRAQNQIIWHIPHRIYGENAFFIKLDVRLSIPRFTQNLVQTIAEGVFTLGTGTNMYAGVTYFPTTTYDEYFVAGDGTGYIYRMFYDINDNGSGVAFTYDTKNMDMGQPDVAKRYTKVIARVDDILSSKLTLEYWADYRNRDAEASEVKEVMSEGKKVTPSLFDVAIFDQSVFDDYIPGTHAVVFNLHGVQNNNEGDSLKLRFSQTDANVPVVIHGFSVVWEELSLRK